MNVSYILIGILSILLILVSNGYKINFFYVILIGIFIYALIREKDDYLDINNKIASKDNSNHSREDLFIELLSSVEYVKNMIVWRQSYIIALISAFLIWFVLTKSFPSGKDLFITTLLIFIVNYGVMNYYTIHFHKEVQNGLREDLFQYNKKINHFVDTIQN
jgi:hypothetical protein